VPGGYFGPEFGALSELLVFLTLFKKATNYKPTNQQKNERTNRPFNQPSNQRSNQRTNQPAKQLTN
jgi:hypothetical protein